MYRVRTYIQFSSFFILLNVVCSFSATGQLFSKSQDTEQQKRDEWRGKIIKNRIDKPRSRNHFLHAPAGPALYYSLVGNMKVPYIVYVPKSYNPAKPTSLVVYLHNDPLIRENFQHANPVVSEQPIFSIADTFNTIILFPFAKIDFVWASDTAVFNNIFNQIKLTESYYNIDKRRVYIGGQGQGGIATYWFIIHAPEIFAGFYTFSALIKEPGIINLSNLTKDKPLYTLNTKDDKIMDFRVVKQFYDRYKTEAPGWHFESIDSGGHRFIFNKDGKQYIKSLIGELLEATKER